jgi:hypothetical protein
VKRAARRVVGTTAHDEHVKGVGEWWEPHRANPLIYYYPRRWRRRHAQVDLADLPWIDPVPVCWVGAPADHVGTGRRVARRHARAPARARSTVLVLPRPAPLDQGAFFKKNTGSSWFGTVNLSPVNPYNNVTELHHQIGLIQKHTLNEINLLHL